MNICSGVNIPAFDVGSRETGGTKTMFVIPRLWLFGNPNLNIAGQQPDDSQPWAALENMTSAESPNGACSVSGTHRTYRHAFPQAKHRLWSVKLFYDDDNRDLANIHLEKAKPVC